MNGFWTALLFIAITILIYLVARWLYNRYRVIWLVPIFTATVILLTVLIAADVEYVHYMGGGRWIEYLLGPAVVALALPFYQQRKMLKKHLGSICVAVSIGVIVGVLSGYGLARLTGFEQELIHSIIPKSVTTPIAMEIAVVLEGDPSLAALFVMVAGVGGVLLADFTFRLFRISSPLARGIGMGSAAHAIGTAKAVENDHLEGAASSIAMTLSAILISILAPLLVLIFT